MDIPILFRDDRFVVPQALQLDEELTLDQGAGVLIAARALLVAVNGAQRLHVLSFRGGEQPVDGCPGRAGTRQRRIADGHRCASGGEHEQQGDALHSRLPFGGCSEPNRTRESQQASPIPI